MTSGVRPKGAMVAGVDGCRGGWLVVRATASQIAEPEIVTELGSLLAEARSGTVAAVAIDMPIGLLADRPRPCDRQARAVLGPRRASVFPAPVRAALPATDYDEACRLSRAACGKAMSKQTFHLLDRIRHLDRLLEPADGQRVIEAHPECAFARLANRPLASKHTAAGRQQRIDLLDRALGSDIAPLAGGRVPIVDLLDAAVLTITANHLVAGTAIGLGGDIDPTGKRAEIFY